MIIYTIISGIIIVLVLSFLSTIKKKLTRNNRLQLIADRLFKRCLSFVVWLLKQSNVCIQLLFSIVVLNRRNRELLSSTNKMNESSNEKNSDETNNLGSFKMFEFVRIRPTKTKKNKRLNQSLSMSNLSSIHQDSIEQTSHVSSESLDQVQASDPSLGLVDQTRYICGIPKKRSGHRAVCNDECLYIWGGYSPREDESTDEDENMSVESHPLLAELWRFHFSTRKWTLLKTTGDSPNDTVASHCGIFLKLQFFHYI
jgi:hypothetical protein